MARETYVLRGGELVPKREAASMTPSAPGVIGDAMQPIRSMADGRMYDSKSQYRQSLRERGCIEVGNERAPFDRKPEFNPGPVAPDIVRAMEQLSSR
jgi:hypothetical protein